MITEQPATSLARICFVAGLLCGTVLGAAFAAIVILTRS